MYLLQADSAKKHASKKPALLRRQALSADEEE
jgi:hypothetical protein